MGFISNWSKRHSEESEELIEEVGAIEPVEVQSSNSLSLQVICSMSDYELIMMGERGLSELLEEVKSGYLTTGTPDQIRPYFKAISKIEIARLAARNVEEPIWEILKRLTPEIDGFDESVQGINLSVKSAKELDSLLGVYTPGKQYLQLPTFTLGRQSISFQYKTLNSDRKTYDFRYSILDKTTQFCLLPDPDDILTKDEAQLLLDRCKHLYSKADAFCTKIEGEIKNRADLERNKEKLDKRSEFNKLYEVCDG